MTRRISILLMVLVLTISGAAFAQQNGDCPADFSNSDYLAPRIGIGGSAEVLFDPPNRARELPDAMTKVLFEIPAGEVFDVLNGPACKDGIVWWEVTYQDQTGWTAESAGGDYYVEPVSTLDGGDLPNGMAPAIPDDALTEPAVLLDEGAEMLKFSQGGVLVVAPDAETNLVDLWDMDTGSRFDMLFDHDPDNIEGASNIVYYSENAAEDLLVTADVIGRVYVWDANLQEQGRIVTDFIDEPVYATDPDFTVVAVGGCVATDGDNCTLGAVEVYDIASQEQLWAQETVIPADTINAIAFSGDGAYIGAAAADGVVALWDVETGTPISEVEIGTSPLRDLGFVPETDLLIVSGCVAYDRGDCTLGGFTVVDWVTGVFVSSVDAHAGEIVSQDIDATGERLATAGLDGLVRVWDLDSYQIIATLVFEANDVKFVNDFNELGTAGDETIAIWTLP